MIAPSLNMNNDVDSQGYRQLVNSTPAIVDYLGPGAKNGSPLHRYVANWGASDRQIRVPALRATGQFLHDYPTSWKEELQLDSVC